jgi:hypothetical protein
VRTSAFWGCDAGEEAIKKHAEVSGFPANSIEEVKAIIDPVVGFGGLINS